MTGQDVPSPIRVACGLLALESLALLGLAGFEAIDTVVGTPNSLGRALSGAGLALAAAVALGLGARALWRLSAAARTPMVVLQLLALPVAYDLAFGAGQYEYGGPLLLAALAVIYLLFTPPARAALDRDITR